MPAAQLVSSLVEQGINQLLALDPDSPAYLKPLANKQLRIELREFPWPLTLAFSQRIDVIVSSTGEQSPVDCKISLNLDALKRLSDSSQLSKLIKEDKLTLEGELDVAQHFSQLMKKVDIDWEEQLSRYLGDPLAHTLVATSKRMIQDINGLMNNFSRSLGEGLIEEKQIAAHPLAVEDFCRQVDSLRSDTARLEARLQRLQ